MSRRSAINLVLFTLIPALLSPVFSQCDIKSKVGFDGSLYSYVEPVNFYFTKDKSLSGGIVTDGEYYFLSLNPRPVPSKEVFKKYKEKLKVELSNGKSYLLDFYYQDFENDSLVEMEFLIDKKDILDFKTYKVELVKINMGGDEGVRTYKFKLHKEALKEQLNCFEKK